MHIPTYMIHQNSVVVTHLTLTWTLLKGLSILSQKYTEIIVLNIKMPVTTIHSIKDLKTNLQVNQKNANNGANRIKKTIITLKKKFPSKSILTLRLQMLKQSKFNKKNKKRQFRWILGSAWIKMKQQSLKS